MKLRRANKFLVKARSRLAFSSQTDHVSDVSEQCPDNTPMKKNISTSWFCALLVALLSGLGSEAETIQEC